MDPDPWSGVSLELVIYGDFNCPFSALASERAARLEATGRAIIDWRAVEHDRTIPPTGSPVDAARRRDFETEIDVVREQLRPGESLGLQPPTVLINTATLNASYAALAPEDRPRVRQRLFHAYWCDGAHMDDPAITASLRAAADGTALAGRWQGEWSALNRPIVPAMLLPAGGVSRGLGVLAHLADYLGQPDEPPTGPAPRTDAGGETNEEGGDAPCWAHLLEETHEPASDPTVHH